MSVYRYEIQSFIEELEISLEEGQELFSTYINEMNKLVIDMEQISEEAELDTLCKIIHSIKGSSGNFCINDVYEETVAFETLLRANKSIDVGFYKTALIERIKAAEEEIRRFFCDNNINL